MKRILFPAIRFNQPWYRLRFYQFDRGDMLTVSSLIEADEMPCPTPLDATMFERRVIIFTLLLEEVYRRIDHDSFASSVHCVF